MIKHVDWPEPSPDDIKALRERHQMTQTEYGRVIQSSLRAVQAWESGDRKMSKQFWRLLNLELISHPNKPETPPLRP